MRFQRAAQSVSLILFLFLLLYAAFPLADGFPVDIFLRLDPLIGLDTALAARQASSFLWPALMVIAVTALVGRIFCGHICPMGITLDVLESGLSHGGQIRVKDRTFEATAGARRWKYLILAFIAAAGVGGVSLAHIGSPLSISTRFYGLAAFPAAALLMDGFVEVASAVGSRLGFYGLAHLQISQKVFAANVFSAVLVVGAAMLAYLQPRFWCRNLCPSGAIMALCAWSPMVRRRVDGRCTRCKSCVRECPTSAICEDPVKTVHSECIVCLRCMEICPEKAITFGPRGAAEELACPSADLRRRGFVVAAGAGLAASGLLRTGIRRPRLVDRERAYIQQDLIRPPGALPEAEFLARCVRCGECMSACPTNTLQPVWLKAGLEGLFTPAMTPRLGACALNCNVCGRVCPTGAIRDIPLIEKQHAKVGTAWIVRQNCLVWEQDRKCLVCDEACPYNAISFRPAEGQRNAAPFVLENRCTGCGWCETKCPVEGASAIRINVIGEVRLAAGSYQEKAKEFGFLFRAKDNTMDRLAPETFKGPEVGAEKTRPAEHPTIRGNDLPPGFTSE